MEKKSITKFGTHAKKAKVIYVFRNGDKYDAGKKIVIRSKVLPTLAKVCVYMCVCAVYVLCVCVYVYVCACVHVCVYMLCIDICYVICTRHMCWFFC